MDTAIELALRTGWCSMLGGIASGAVIGLFFHREDWMGGYASHRRRLTRLGHISFFGIGFLNLFYALSLPHLVTGDGAEFATFAGALSLLVAAVAMPTCCFLCAWRKPFRHLFPVPVIATMVGIAIALFL